MKVGLTGKPGLSRLLDEGELMAADGRGTLTIPVSFLFVLGGELLSRNCVRTFDNPAYINNNNNNPITEVEVFQKTYI